METGGMFLILDIIIAVYGAYLIYNAWNLRKNGEIGRGIWSKDLPMRKCRDKEGFSGFMVPRLLVCGILVLADGILGILDDKITDLPLAVSLLPMIIILIVVIWYIVFSRKAQRLFF